ncbi:MAG: hypothetical protein OEZ34_16620 [Spirochaetia bacterium]|nr:hypothetical protein [Spirochaetia bacterium]
MKLQKEIQIKLKNGFLFTFFVISLIVSRCRIFFPAAGSGAGKNLIHKHSGEQ